MSKIVLLKYQFLFDPANSWQHLNQFENDLRDFFIANGFDTEVITPIGGQMGDRILQLRRMDFISKAQNPNPVPQSLPKQPSEILKGMQQTRDTAGQRDFKKGKVLTRKGYLKR